MRILHTDYEENDPRSNFYIRTHVIPEIDWWMSLRRVLVPILLGILSSGIVLYFFQQLMPAYVLESALVVFITGIFLYVLLRAKSILIWGIKVYQHYAPIRVRDKCRFEPSCSVYMIQAIEKYGAIKGVILGIKRLRKCNISGGGYDYL
ncbi:membrane protein insertion efficiency factor YidD [Paenibacillus sp. NPDC058177]|uniref:membrane protein insertion efficiency factor YidD n=1 Tax=Paenibacillus sp. NPDC058177 TaxID=3346369 RepID=UPI0036DE62D0